MRLIYRKKRVTPSNAVSYVIASDVVSFTEVILREYGNQRISSEGVVYWSGKLQDGTVTITSAVAPQTCASRYGFEVSHKSNAEFVEYIRANNLVYLIQVHSHPGTWVDHSDIDDRNTAFRREGLVSIVVPSFSKDGMSPLSRCGIHLFTKGAFYRLTNKYVKKQFSISSISDNLLLKDLRHGK